MKRLNSFSLIAILAGCSTKNIHIETPIKSEVVLTDEPNNIYNKEEALQLDISYHWKEFERLSTGERLKFLLTLEGFKTDKIHSSYGPCAESSNRFRNFGSYSSFSNIAIVKPISILEGSYQNCRSVREDALKVKQEYFTTNGGYSGGSPKDVESITLEEILDLEAEMVRNPTYFPVSVKDDGIMISGHIDGIRYGFVFASMSQPHSLKVYEIPLGRSAEKINIDYTVDDVDEIIYDIGLKVITSSLVEKHGFFEPVE